MGVAKERCLRVVNRSFFGAYRGGRPEIKQRYGKDDPPYEDLRVNFLVSHSDHELFFPIDRNCR